MRSHMMWLPHHHRLGAGVERGHMTCLPHLARICPGMESARTHDVSAAPLPVLYSLFSKDVVGPGIVGPDAKATGPRLAQHLSGPDGAQHDACADAHYARKNKRRARDITHLTTVHEKTTKNTTKTQKHIFKKQKKTKNVKKEEKRKRKRKRK